MQVYVGELQNPGQWEPRQVRQELFICNTKCGIKRASFGPSNEFWWLWKVNRHRNLFARRFGAATKLNVTHIPTH